MKLNKLSYPFIIIVAILALMLGISFFPPQVKAEESSTYQTKTLTELKAPTIAGTSAYMDDGILYYNSGGNTVGFNLDHSNTLFDFNIFFKEFSFPNWFSLTFKASGLDRTQSSNLEQKGYSFEFFPAGQIYIVKDGQKIATINQKFSLETKYNFKIGAINENENVRLILKIDDKEIVNLVDNDNAYLTGNWFNVCGEGAVKTELHTTKKIIIPNYYTYTMSTMQQYPTTVGNPKIDKCGNVEITGSSDVVGYNQFLQNFSLEMKFNFKTFEWPGNFAISTRASGFSRATGGDLKRKGYVFWFSPSGGFTIYKNGSTLTSGNAGKFNTNTDYIIEVGTVDINPNSTYVFFSVNNKVIASLFDNENPIQSYGHINMSGEGKINCTIKSADTKLSPLQTKVEETESFYDVITYFQNPFAYRDLSYADFSERNLKSISINDRTVYEINKNYYALEKSNQIQAVDISYYSNILKIRVYKNLYTVSTNASQPFSLENISFLRPSVSNGLESESGYVLKQTYTHFFQ